MSLDEKFNAAASSVKDMKSRPSDTELLELYALYKQATVGDCSTAEPGALDLKGKAKWNAWNGKKGMAQDAAKEAYVSYANTLSSPSTNTLKQQKAHFLLLERR